MADRSTLKTRSQFAGIIRMQERWSQVCEEVAARERWLNLCGEHWAQQNCALDTALESSASGVEHHSLRKAMRCHVSATELLSDLAQSRSYLDSEDLRAIHRAMLLGIRSSAGQFRERDVQLEESQPTEAELIEPVIENACQWFRSDSFGQMHEVERSALMLMKLVDIYPFETANGRTLRVFSSFFLLRAGYPPVIINAACAPEYAAAIKQALRFETQPIVDLIVASIDSSFRHLLNEPPLPPALRILNS